MPTPAMESCDGRDEGRHARFAMRLSLIFGLAMLIGKTAAYLMRHSAAIFSDAAESVIHVIAVGFATFSLRLSTKPASSHFLYGYERINFFSAGFEGAMIVVGADAVESITCGWLSFVVVIGLLAQLALGAWWVDSAASLAIVYFLIKGRSRLTGEGWE